MIALSNYNNLTPEEYLQFEEKSPIKHEYIDGQIYAMAGTTDTHNIIGLNFTFIIRNHLRGSDCRVYFADVKVRLEKRNHFYYPDIIVTCDDRDRETATYKSFPKLIIEVLSDSTEAFDRGEKIVKEERSSLILAGFYRVFSPRNWDGRESSNLPPQFHPVEVGA